MLIMCNATTKGKMPDKTGHMHRHHTSRPCVRPVARQWTRWRAWQPPPPQWGPCSGRASGWRIALGRLQLEPAGEVVEHVHRPLCTLFVLRRNMQSLCSGPLRSAKPSISHRPSKVSTFDGRWGWGPGACPSASPRRRQARGTRLVTCAGGRGRTPPADLPPPARRPPQRTSPTRPARPPRDGRVAGGARRPSGGDPIATGRAGLGL